MEPPILLLQMSQSSATPTPSHLFGLTSPVIRFLLIGPGVKGGTFNNSSKKWDFADVKRKLKRTQAMSLTLDAEWEVCQTSKEIMIQELFNSLYRHCGYNMLFSSHSSPSFPATIPSQENTIKIF
ncbi:hypothetical protein VP01_747g7 [Puccinia sorghi]|uniref:Uncharacterized protein n=1 Tax=Puccinia sorghi TaxID=27349 RepID=A0A0L6UCE0_9BASI|nr:hypothetical protein VP01_747g7 [Puccinia sorghi]